VNQLLTTWGVAWGIACCSPAVQLPAADHQLII